MRPHPDSASPANAGADVRKIKVWDPGVRLFHWLLLCAVGIAAATGFLERKSLVDVHVYAGTAIAVLLLLRLVWGFTGTTYARLSSFVCSPFTSLRYGIGVLTGRAPLHAGHNPLGAAMILALVAVLLGLVLTGTVVLAGVLKEGPLAFATSYAAGRTVKELHEGLAYLLLGLAGLHVAGVLIESLRERQSLVKAMITGTKAVHAGTVEAPAAMARPFSALMLSAALLASLTACVAVLSQLPAKGMPRAGMNATYERECKSCHSPHHPSVAPAATWAALFSGLDSHFGDNAGLDERTTKALLAYAVANAAEEWDTLAANRLRKPSAAEPLRITATDGWRRLHRHVPAAAFASRAVGGKANCSRCHADAESGRFAPRHIAIPQEK